MSRRILAVLAGAALLCCSSVQAAALCSADGPHPNGIDVSDVTFNGKNASDCWGVVSGIATAANLGFEDATPFLLNATPGGLPVTGSLGDITFTLSAADVDTGLGTWTLGWSSGGPATVDFIAVIQDATSFSSYLFDELALPDTAGQATNRWTLNFTKEDIPLLSAFSIYARDLRTPNEPPPPPPPTAVDEPGTLALLALGAIALGGLARRRQQVRRV